MPSFRFAKVNSVCFDQAKDISRAQARERDGLLNCQTLDLFTAPAAPGAHSASGFLTNDEGLALFGRDHNLFATTITAQPVPLPKTLAFHERDFYPFRQRKVL
jgi:hypothetical protein